MDYVRKQTYLTPEQDLAVKRLARRRHVTEAQILRQALDAWLASEERRVEDDPFERMIGVFDGPTEVDHNDIYR